MTHSFSKVIFREEEKKMENAHVPFYITSSCSEHYDSFTRKTSVKVKFFSQNSARAAICTVAAVALLFDAARHSSISV